MSADLLAAFGDLVESDANSDHFESSKPDSSSTERGAHTQTEADPWILQSRPIDQPQSKASEPPLWKQDNQGVEVLFDASDAEQVDDDDFGDFETVPVQPQILRTASVPAHQSIDLLGLDDFSTNDTPPQQGALPVSVSDHYKSEVGVLLDNRETSNGNVKSSKVYQPDLEHSLDLTIPTGPDQPQDLRFTQQSQGVPEDDDWGDFENVEAPATRKAVSKSALISHPTSTDISQPTTNDLEWDMFEDGPSTKIALPAQPVPVQTQEALDSIVPTARQPATSTTSTLTNQPRPTNIPPPSTLLQLLPQIYTNLSVQSRSLNQGANLAHQTLQSYIVTSRLISGRQLRWKRDTLLSQSTRISQAGLKNTGMKLTALDRSSTIKEDQDVQEAMSAWQRHAAALNAIILKAKLQKPPMSLSSNMAVRSVSGPGVLTARECCAVCGLKRNERVVGIDIKVEDTFGEFWIEHWGHRDCSEFWYAHEHLLSRR